MAMTYQEFLRQNEQYNKQRGITTGQPVTNAYGPPEYLATYLAKKYLIRTVRQDKLSLKEILSPDRWHPTGETFNPT